jgi:hypothetical protein
MIEKTIEIQREGIVITQRDSRVSWGGGKNTGASHEVYVFLLLAMGKLFA